MIFYENRIFKRLAIISNFSLNQIKSLIWIKNISWHHNQANNIDSSKSQNYLRSFSETVSETSKILMGKIAHVLSCQLINVTFFDEKEE